MLWGEKVKLAPMKVEDVKEMLYWEKHTDELFLDYNFPMWTDTQVQRWYEGKVRGNRECFSIFDGEAVLIGYIALRKVNPILKTGEIGILLRPNALNKQFGRDAIKVFLNWAFEVKGLRKIRLLVAKYNARAIRCYEAIGFYKRRTFYDTCFNNKIEPFHNDSYKEIRRYFQRIGRTLFVEYDQMEITRPALRQMKKAV